MKNLVYGIVFGLFLSGCASQGLGHYNAEQVVEVDYARVVETSPFTFESHVEEAAVIGGIEGALFNIDEEPEDMVAGAIGGALVSALFMKIEEGSNKGLLLNLYSTNDYEYSVATKNTHIRVDQCLKVIKGMDVSLETVPDYYCNRY